VKDLPKVRNHNLSLALAKTAINHRVLFQCRSFKGMLDSKLKSPRQATSFQDLKIQGRILYGTGAQAILAKGHSVLFLVHLMAEDKIMI